MPLSRSFEQSRPVALWLFAVAALVFAMIMLGGATRLTDAGLSITEWRPVTGTIPPLSDRDWAQEFQKYQQIPEYRQVNPNMTLAGFKAIFWWEWAHRFLGRLIGVVFALPFIVFLATRRMSRRLAWRCWVLLALGGLQGLVGWWMVASGLSGRVDVLPERLTLHLGLALVVFCLLIWTALEAWSGPGRPDRATRWHWATGVLAALVLVQVLLGGLVAGNDAGRIYTDWPLMNGEVFPSDYLGQGGFLRALLHSQAAVQFNHRIGAYIVFVVATAAAAAALRSRRRTRGLKGLAVTVAALVLAQVGLGIATLMNAAPLGLSLAHQALAAVVLAFAVALAWRARRA